MYDYIIPLSDIQHIFYITYLIAINNALVHNKEH